MISIEFLIPWVGIALSTACFFILMAIAPEESELNSDCSNSAGLTPFEGEDTYVA